MLFDTVVEVQSGLAKGCEAFYRLSEQLERVQATSDTNNYSLGTHKLHA
jgi:hypothetical protein